MFKNIFKLGAIASMMLAVNANAQTWSTDASTKSVKLNPADANVVIGATPSSSTASSKMFVKYGSNQNGLTVVNANGETQLQLTKDGTLSVNDLDVNDDAYINSLTVNKSASFNGGFDAYKSCDFREGLTSWNGLSVGSSNKMYRDFVSISGTNGNMKLRVSGYGGIKPFTFEASKFVFSNGNVGIGVTNPTVALDIVGDIKCKGNVDIISMNSQAINVDNLAAKDITMDMKNAADYVFDSNYDLKSLSEVESYVNEHHHLPGIPSAAEMDANGVSVSKMSNLLLEKIEELTLHMIQLEKENAQLRAKFESLEK